MLLFLAHPSPMVDASLPIPDESPYVSYTVTTSTPGPFNVPFPLPMDWAGSLKVRIGGSSGTEITTFEFTPDATVASGHPSGTIMLAANVQNTTVEIWRDTPIYRGSDYGSGPLDFDAFNTELTRLAMQVQDQRLHSDLIGPNAVAAALEAANLAIGIRPSFINVKKYGAKGNIVRCLGSVAIGSSTLNITYGSIPASHAGKTVWVQYAAGGSAPLITPMAVRISGTQCTLTSPNVSGSNLVSVEICIGDDDTIPIKAARDAMPANGAILFFPRDATDPECTGLYGWTDPAGLIIGDGSAAAPSTKQNQILMGDVGGTGDMMTFDVQGTGLCWFGAGIADYLVRFKGPMRGGAQNLAFECLYRVNWGWDLKHVYSSDFINCPINHARQKGVKLGAYPSPAGGVFIGAGNNYFRRVRPSSPGVTGFIGFDIGEDTFVNGLDPATCIFDSCNPAVADDAGAAVVNGVLVGTANTSICFALRFCDNISFRDCFTYVAGQRRGWGIRVIVPAGVGGAPYPSEISIIGDCPSIGGFSVDNTAQTWAPETNGARGVNYDCLHDGDMTDPAYLGAVAIPTPDALGINEGISGKSSRGFLLARHQEQMARAGITTFTLAVIEPRNCTALAVANTAVETDVFVLDLPKNIMRVFDRVNNAYVINRIIEARFRADYKNDSGGNDNLTFKVYVGNAVDGWVQIFTTGALSVPASALFRRMSAKIEIAARTSLSAQFMDGEFSLGAASTASATAGDKSFDKVQSNNLTLDMTKAQQLRMTVQMGTAAATILTNVNYRFALIH